MRSPGSTLRRAYDTLSNTYNDLPWPDCITLSCTALKFRPDLVIELGHAHGRSTALFRCCELPVVSICRTRHWLDETVPALHAVQPIDWQKGIIAIVGEISDQ